MVVKARSTLIQYVRGVVKSAGGRIPHCDARTFAHKAVLHLPSELEPVLSPVVATIANMDKTIVAYDKQIEQMTEERYPETELLQQVAGVGAITAATFVLTVEDPTAAASAPILACARAKTSQGPSRNSSASPRPETSTCARYSSAVRNTSSDTLVRTPIFVGGACIWLSEAARTARSGPSWPSRASSRCSSCGYG
jgi:hypothetical protein